MSVLSLVRVRQLLKKELRQIFRDPRMKRIVFIAPVIQLVAFGYAVNTDIKNTKTFVIDHDRSAASRELLEVVEATGYFRIVGSSQRPADLVDALDFGRAEVGIEIPAGFSRDLADRRGARVQVILDGTNSNTATVAQGYLTYIVQGYAQNRAAAAGALPGGGVDARVRAWYNPDLESRVYNVPGVIGMLILLMSLLLTSLSVVREREMGTLDQLTVSPLSAAELMLGKTVPATLVALIDLVLVTALAILWFNIPMRGSFLDLLPAALLYILCGLAFGLLISSVSRTQQEAFMTMFLVLMPAIILSGFFYPISSMPEVFQWITVLNPVRHFLEIVRAIFLKGAGIADLWVQYAALTVMAGGATWLAIVRFRRSMAL
ncbi:MAG: ABC transporter permease [Gemmatimonadetes bacterium]|nr:ABC transporter permease [Gemmatimonadota bacterium]NIO30558.1 ABC transporter permease [Gemmatimonadota bacterium]